MKAGLDPSDPEFGEYLSIEVHDKIHAYHTPNYTWGNGGPWNYQWEKFFQANPNASAADVRSFLQQLLTVVRGSEADVEKMAWPYLP